jgi:hypothetical protein
VLHTTLFVCKKTRHPARRRILVIARDRRHIVESERIQISAKYEEIAKMLTGLIGHLEAEDRKHRR